MSKVGTYDGPHDDGPGFVGIKFCQECNNMLYPKEDKENKVLLYAVSLIYFFLYSCSKTVENNFEVMFVYFEKFCLFGFQSVYSAEIVISKHLLKAAAFTSTKLCTKLSEYTLFS